MGRVIIVGSHFILFCFKVVDIKCVFWDYEFRCVGNKHDWTFFKLWKVWKDCIRNNNNNKLGIMHIWFNLGRILHSKHVWMDCNHTKFSGILSKSQLECVLNELLVFRKVDGNHYEEGKCIIAKHGWYHIHMHCVAQYLHNWKR